MACQVLRCGRPADVVPAVPTPRTELDGYALCGEHRRALDDGAPWTPSGPDSLLVGPDALYHLPRAVKSLRAGVADVVERSRGRGLVQLDLTVGLEGTADHDRDLSVVLPLEAARALGIALLDLADEAEGLK